VRKSLDAGKTKDNTDAANISKEEKSEKTK